MAVIDASKLVFGRLASIVAERALKGEQIDIVNVEKAVIIGPKYYMVREFQSRIDMGAKGNPERGPKYPKTPQGLMRHAIKGMLPDRKPRGMKALKRVRAYVGIPKKLQKDAMETIKIALYNGKEDASELGEISKSLGWTWSK
ncbi:MAG: 50S ribosomal protein L13 [Candidatus Diapherotrites archaeon]|nr:50S ribosomal protein L13 [Candidatus Diapherotrites archaeon]